MSEEMPMLQSVAGRRCERSIDDMERAALVYITKEVHNSFGDTVLVALLADYVRMGREYGDYVRMGREYGDVMNSDGKNMLARVEELERLVDDLRGELAQSDRAADKTRIAELEAERNNYKAALSDVVKTLDRPMLRDVMCLYQNGAVKIARKALEGN